VHFVTKTSVNSFGIDEYYAENGFLHTKGTFLPVTLRHFLHLCNGYHFKSAFSKKISLTFFSLSKIAAFPSVPKKQ
jgi:hypothetical protein